MTRGWEEMARQAAVRSLALAALAALVACSGDVNPVRDVVVAVGAGPEPARTPDFVARTRPSSSDYLPIGAEPPARSEKARTTTEVQAAQAELDAVRTANEAAAAAASAQAGATTPATAPAAALPAPARPPAPAAKPKRGLP
jgi:hypothetical protein